MTDEPRRPSRWLDAAVVAGAAATFIAVAPFSAGHDLIVVGLDLAALVLAWMLLGRRAYGGGPRWPLLFGVVVTVAAIGAVVSPAFATIQVVAFPLVWMISPGFRPAIAMNCGLAIAIGIGYALNSTVVEALAVQGISLAFSLALGMWISRIEAVSESRLELVRRLTAAQEEVAVMSREAGTVAERERLARELHDTLAQSLAGIVMLAERARAQHAADAGLGVLEDAARQALAEARGLVTASAGVPLEGGLALALATLAERFRRETGLQVDVHVTALPPRGLEVVLLRCAQEGLANVRKHAGAARVAVEVRESGAETVLTVADDGRGPSGGSGFGLDGMRDRLALVGGSAGLAPGVDGGAVLSVRVPAPAAESAGAVA